jgi:NTE family protein
MVIVLVLNRHRETSSGNHVQSSYTVNGYHEYPEFKRSNAKYNLGLALSGGGIKGFCHVGVLKAFEESGIKPDILSGVSSGAMVAALYADGYSPDSIVKTFEKISLAPYFRIGITDGGLLSMQGFRELLDTLISADTFEELSIPLRIVATDLDNGKSVVFDKGNLVDAIVASSSVPILFTPYEINGINYVDGGVMKNLPASTIRSDCKILIGVSAGPMDTDMYEKSITQIALRSYKFIFRSNATQEKNLCDILIEPENISDFNGASLGSINAIYNLGYKETLTMLDSTNLKARLKK